MPGLDPEKQRQFAIDVVDRLRAAGHEAFWAGGCVRDLLLERTPKDYDVATDARPEKIRDLFTRRRTLAIGAAFGVITVLGPPGAGQIEVATFRHDASYSDGRHPDAVSFSTPEEDARRRDFTINGLFYEPLGQRVVDYVRGQEDLQAGIVRAIGDPRERFREDKLRLLRAVRFAATLDFKIEAATLDAIRELAPEITVVSAERIAAEMQLMLVHPTRARAAELLRESGLLPVLLPELDVDAVHARSPGPSDAGQPPPDPWQRTLDVLGRLGSPTFPVALSALLRWFVDAARAQQVCRRWKLSNRHTESTQWLLEHQGSLLAAQTTPWPRLQRLLIEPEIRELLAFDQATADVLGLDKSGLEFCRVQLDRPPDELNPTPLITGDDLIRHGVPRGKHYQTLLERVRDAQLEGTIRSKDEALRLVDELRDE